MQSHNFVEAFADGSVVTYSIHIDVFATNMKVNRSAFQIRERLHKVKRIYLKSAEFVINCFMYIFSFTDDREGYPSNIY